MVFLLFFLTLIGSTSWAVLHLLIAPAAQIYPWIFPLHLVFYALGFISFAMVLLNRLSSGFRSEHGIWYYAGAYLFSFLGLHSLFFTGLILAWLVITISSMDIALASLSSLIVSYTLAILGIIVALRGPRLVKVHLSTEGKSEKLKILQISDLHIGVNLGHKYVSKVVDIVLANSPDCIVLTGDIGDGEPHRHEEAIAELAKLKAPLGVFLVLGNHELYWPREEWKEVFQKLGMKVLVDELWEYSTPSKKFSMIGLAPYPGKSLEEILASSNSVPPRIVLSHYPHRAQEAADAGIDLFLAGHTHGGQFWPWSWFIYFFHRYAKGLYRVNKTHIYVNRGTGYWGPPFRFGQRAEITLIEFEW